MSELIVSLNPLQQAIEKSPLVWDAVRHHERRWVRPAIKYLSAYVFANGQEGRGNRVLTLPQDNRELVLRLSNKSGRGEDFDEYLAWGEDERLDVSLPALSDMDLPGFSISHDTSNGMRTIRNFTVLQPTGRQIEMICEGDLVRPFENSPLQVILTYKQSLMAARSILADHIQMTVGPR